MLRAGCGARRVGRAGRAGGSAGVTPTGGGGGAGEAARIWSSPAPSSMPSRRAAEPHSRSMKKGRPSSCGRHNGCSGYRRAIVDSSVWARAVVSRAVASVRCSCTPCTCVPAHFEKVGRKTASRTVMPGRSCSRSAAARRASVQSVPISSKGRVVPRPSDSVVPSMRPVAGYSIAVCSVGMFGEGITHGPARSAGAPSQPAVSMTVSSGVVPVSAGTWSAANQRASSPSVSPCCRGTLTRPTKLEKALSRPGPATVRPSGFGRSSTVTGSPMRAAEHSRSKSVQV